MKIVVVAECMDQYRDFVGEAIKSGIYLNVTRRGSIILLEGIEFIFATSDMILRGRAFTSEDKLIYVGSWYKLSTKVLDDIERSFRCRVKK